MSILPREIAAPGEKTGRRIEPRLNQVFIEAASLKGISIFLLVASALARVGIFIGWALLIGYGIYLLLLALLLVAAVVVIQALGLFVTPQA